MPRRASGISSHEWERIERNIDQALLHGGETHTGEDVRAGIEAGNFGLWSVGQTDVIVDVHEYPMGRWLHVWLCAGRLDEAMILLDDIERYGLAEGYAGISMTGRNGWAREFKIRGYERLSHFWKAL